MVRQAHHPEPTCREPQGRTSRRANHNDRNPKYQTVLVIEKLRFEIYLAGDELLSACLRHELRPNVAQVEDSRVDFGIRISQLIISNSTTSCIQTTIIIP